MKPEPTTAEMRSAALNAVAQTFPDAMDVVGNYLTRLEGENEAMHETLHNSVGGVWTDYEAEKFDNGLLRWRVAVLEGELREARETARDFAAVVSESRGIAGWHLNDAEAAWGEFEWVAVLERQAALALAEGAGDAKLESRPMRVPDVSQEPRELGDDD